MPRSEIAINLLWPILDNLSTAVLAFDKELKLQFINPAGENLLAVSRKQAEGMELARLMPRATELAEKLKNALQQGHMFTEYQVTLPLNGAPDIAVDYTVTPIGQTTGEQCLLLEMVNIDRHVQITREEHRLSQYEISREVIRGLAHEIKNPLGGLRGAAQLLETELPDPALKEYTDVIISEADRLQNLLNRMLGPNTLPHKEKINIHQVLEHVRTLVLAEDTGNLTITRDYDPSIPLLYADADQMVQVILNIARNAAQALNGNGNITLYTRADRYVTIGSQRHKLVLRLEIRDNGPGIPDDMVEKIFYPMVSMNASGSGLGLAIAQSLLHQHGGLIECTSEPQNTVFKITLPLESRV
ncbi:MAG: nitrogen regulation protein NR(II) [Gammaproteobacteria bacterium]|nr:nitrogen regulation protein NR(II) [Beggiatoa alba]PCH59777.1 MAG: nitrogen regulation protein NR(II) [Gammaproteobacteria bacterium]